MHLFIQTIAYLPAPKHVLLSPSKLLLLLELLLDLLLGESSRSSLQHSSPLIQRQSNLVADGHKTLGERLVILHHESNSDHKVVDVVEDNGVLFSVSVLGLLEMHGVLAPVATGVEMVRGVVAVVVALTVALCIVSICFRLRSGSELTMTSITVMLER